MLWEDADTNRLIESKNIFKEMLDIVYFSATSIFLFLNKKDIFESKIKEDKLSRVRKQERVNHIKFRFTGPEGDVEAAMKFLKETFLTTVSLVNCTVE